MTHNIVKMCKIVMLLRELRCEGGAAGLLSDTEGKVMCVWDMLIAHRAN